MVCGSAFRIGGVLGLNDPHHVVAYRGYGTARRVLVLGRALEDEGIGPASDADPVWRNLVNSLKRLEIDPLPNARVRVRVGSTELEIIADDEGFISEWLNLADPLPSSLE